MYVSFKNLSLKRDSKDLILLYMFTVYMGFNDKPKGTGEYDKFFADGVYTCAGCGTPLSKSTTKFNSGCGWPTFYEGLPRAITCTADPDGMRTRITCTACGGQLGHVFKGEGFKTPTDERHCVNSISIKFTSEGISASL
ncbi:putative peptide-methionine (R)-S-oxide reductase [Helianthus annuus]|nr:putative peptide-methionine (R)-S-oxide reductase [Helianthus annuus]